MNSLNAIKKTEKINDDESFAITEKDLESRLNHSYLVGQYVGLNEASGLLMKQSIQYYNNDQDEKAFLLRSISKQLKKISEERHPGIPKT